ncbi:hypothetical protein V7S43_018976 [Phytophthora oleae]|uniref:PiggyBac transposable element-derived protein domain-containing protein n=1 Tax=Phytophthora oleae TaxID=2107226 RepID=A0ABD3EPN3_9STRA
MEAAQHADLTPKAAGQWYAYARDVCTAEMLRRDMQPCLRNRRKPSMKKKQKYNHGKKHPDYWFFGGVNRTTKKGFATVVYDDRTKPTLSRRIKKYIKPGPVEVLRD